MHQEASLLGGFRDGFCERWVDHHGFNKHIDAEPCVGGDGNHHGDASTKTSSRRRCRLAGGAAANDENPWLGFGREQWSTPAHHSRVSTTDGSDRTLEQARR